MRWVDRGPEPKGVAEYSDRFTVGWIRYCRDRTTERPDDDFWRDFTHYLRQHFDNRCGYCERKCDYYAESGDMAPSVDHFCPRCECPHLVYEWTNWIYSCQRCNHHKSDKWSNAGYVDPCSADIAKRPEHYFDFDTKTGEIIPKKGLSDPDLLRARNTIRDFGLNEYGLPELRLNWTHNLREDMSKMARSDRQALLYEFTNPADDRVEFVGITKMIAGQIGMAEFTYPTV